VAINGARRSLVTDALYFVCNYVLPDEVISGALNVSTIPEGQDILRSKLAAHLNAPTDRVLVNVKVIAKGQTSDEARWLRVPVRNPRPKHRLVFNVKHVTVRKADKANQFINKITKDMLHQKACGEKPEHATISSHKKNTAMEFTLTRAAADELVRQLKDPDSFLCSQARCKGLWAGASYETIDSLGEHVMQPALYTYLSQLLGKGSWFSAEQIVGVGRGDTGTLGFKAMKSTKKLKKCIAKAVKDSLPFVEQEDVRESPAELQFDYIVDVVGDQSAGGSTVAQRLCNESFPERFSQELAEVLPTQIAAQTQATSRELHRLQFRLSWELGAPSACVTDAGPIQGFLDGFCLVYADSKLLRVFDLESDRGAARHQHRHDWEAPAPEGDTAHLVLMRAIGRAMWHGDDSTSEAGSKSRVCELDLHTLPPEVTDIYFVLAAGPVDTLASFPNLSMRLTDAATGRQLSDCGVEHCEEDAMIMCALSHPPGSRTWMLHNLAQPTQGGLQHFEHISALIMERQANYDRWARKRHLIELRILHKLKWISRDSSSQLARLMWGILDLPPACFQALCNMF